MPGPRALKSETVGEGGQATFPFAAFAEVRLKCVELVTPGCCRALNATKGRCAFAHLPKGVSGARNPLAPYCLLLEVTK